MVEKSTRGYRIRALLNASFTVILLIFLFNRGVIFRNKFPRQGLGYFSSPTSIHHRRLIEKVSSVNSSELENNYETEEVGNPQSLCSGLARSEGSVATCKYVRSHAKCDSDGFFDYLAFFYCTCAKFPALGYTVLGLWMVALFYLLGNTAADYFCSSLANMSSLLRLSPTVSGVTLLPLGNGAPDVFASIAAFMGSSGSGGVGLNSVLGGATFVTCIVVGTVSFCVADKNVQIDRKCFIRDVSFFLFTLTALSIILIIGKIGVFGALMFVLIYVLYALIVAANELLREQAHRLKLDSLAPLLPPGGSIFSYACEEDLPMYSHFLDDNAGTDAPHLNNLPQWFWASHVAIYSNQGFGHSHERPRTPWGWKEEEKTGATLLGKLLNILEIPLSVPRRLTIPVVEEDRWSKVYAVASATLSPILLTLIWNSQHDEGSVFSNIVFLVGALVGGVLGILALIFTSQEHPPRKYLLLWVSGGFVMSIVWFYMIAGELLSLLVSLGLILQINPSILGLTVLAWGNSMGDLMSNVALALNGGDAVQVAMSGCYAGPMFNTLAGLGISMLLGACSARPASFMLPQDSSWIYTMAFLMSGLVWALFVLPRNAMRPNKLLGFGLVVIYLIFISIRVSDAIGLLNLLLGVS